MLLTLATVKPKERFSSFCISDVTLLGIACFEILFKLYKALTTPIATAYAFADSLCAYTRMFIWGYLAPSSVFVMVFAGIAGLVAVAGIAGNVTNVLFTLGQCYQQPRVKK